MYRGVLKLAQMDFKGEKVVWVLSEFEGLGFFERSMCMKSKVEKIGNFF